jgi:hypothetical protein
LAAELDKDGREEGAGVFFCSVLEIEEEIGHVCRSCVGYMFNILDNHRADGTM